MALTPQQLVILKANILADGVLNAFPDNSDGAFEIMKAYNLTAAPNFTVWKTLVAINQVGQKFDGVELDGLSAINHTRLQTLAIYMTAGVNPSLSSVRGFFDGVFSGTGGANTRAALLVLWKRLATRGEKLFATGTGTDVAPATLVHEGNISTQDVLNARALP